MVPNFLTEIEDKGKPIAELIIFPLAFKKYIVLWCPKLQIMV